MLTLTLKPNEAVVIDNRVSVVPTKILEMEVAVDVYADEPFHACDGEEFEKRRRRPDDRRTNFEFVLKPEERIHIDNAITAVFIVAGFSKGDSERKARFGFEGPRNTTLHRKEMIGELFKQFDSGWELISPARYAIQRFFCEL